MDQSAADPFDLLVRALGWLPERHPVTIFDAVWELILLAVLLFVLAWILTAFAVVKAVDAWEARQNERAEPPGMFSGLHPRRRR